MTTTDEATTHGRVLAPVARFDAHISTTGDTSAAAPDPAFYDAHRVGDPGGERLHLR